MRQYPSDLLWISCFIKNRPLTVAWSTKKNAFSYKIRLNDRHESKMDEFSEKNALYVITTYEQTPYFRTQIFFYVSRTKHFSCDTDVCTKIVSDTFTRWWRVLWGTPVSKLRKTLIFPNQFCLPMQSELQNVLAWSRTPQNIFIFTWLWRTPDTHTKVQYSFPAMRSRQLISCHQS